ncbi:uncharacterized protein LOC142217151 [Leptodactylus fuscus]|uniref:uncharacterized protein LOC142217151 n=1 Tax=Leptodactylus fuscus TaxID=238119 RepID=UPI003F4E5C63
MEGIRRILCLLVVCHSASPLQPTGPSVHAARLGSDTLVPCPFTLDSPSVDLAHLRIFWFFQDKEVLSYNKTVRTTSSRYSLNTKELKTGIADLSISNVQIQDGGMYKCSVTYIAERKEKEIRLDIGTPPQVTITDKTVVMNTTSVLRCSITGFYPVDIDVKWFRGAERLRNVTEDAPQRNPDRTYNMISSVTIIPTKEDMEQIFSCRVQHEYLQEPLQEDFELVDKDRSSAGIIAACSVIGLILIVIIAVVLWWKLRRKDTGSFTVRDIEGPAKLIDGEEATLRCTVDDCPEGLCVTWLIRRDGQDQEIQTSQMRGHEEEEESLLDTSYVIKSRREGRQYLISLSFIPHMERHRDVTFICRGVFNKYKDKKTFNCTTIYGKPRLSQPITRSLNPPGHMKYLLNLEKFYPKNIRIVWTCGVERKEEVVSSTDTISDNPDRSYNVSSEVTITEDRHKDPEFRVRVTWEHESMEEPESRELSIRDKDYIWTPVVEDIQIPRLHHNTPATLQCNISGYFPDAVTVKWMRRAGYKVYEETDNNQRIISRRVADNTYMCTASLTITPTLGTHQGAKYICVVNHPSLERPIERSTGRLRVIAEPELSEPVRKNLLFSGVQYGLKLENFYPEKINIEWRCIVRGTEEVVSSTDSYSKNHDGTHNVSSEVRISQYYHKDPEFRVRVTWEHESMEEPECRELSIRDKDYIWIPVIEDIQIPRLHHNTPVTLQCNISGYFPDVVTVKWLRRTGYKVYEETDTADNQRIISGRAADNTYMCTASLTITPTLGTHQGAEYICVVNHPSLERPIERSTGRLQVIAEPKLLKPITRSLLNTWRDSKMKYMLSLERFYPNDIRIVWTCGVERTEEVVSSTEKISDNPDRSYNISSEITIPEGRHKDPGFRVQVTWEHESMEEPETRELSIRDKDYIWTPVVEDIQIPCLHDNTPATLWCNISGYFPDAVTVKWLRRAGDEIYEETDTNQRLRIESTANKTYMCTASLTITPTLGTHQGAEYICVVNHPSLERPIERSTGRLQVIAEPKLLKPITRSLLNTGRDSKMKYMLSLERFYPNDIRIVWTCGVERTEEVVSSTEKISDNPDRSYNISSEITIPEGRHKDPGFRVRVTWEHESMEEPETRELSIRDKDYIWTPVIEDIQIPRLHHNTPATLWYNISGYFPDAVTVKWLRRAGDEIYEETDTNQRLRIESTANNTYMCTASLTITPTSETHQGAEYICVVNHPSLERPIERSTGRLQVIVSD